MTFQEAGIYLPHGAHGNIKLNCPKCATTKPYKHKGSENSKDLSVDVDNGLWKCHRCGWSGGIHTKVRKEYAVPVKVELPLSEKAVGFFKERGINEVSLRRLGVYSEMQYVGKFKKEVSCICFPYFRNGELVNVKYRAPEKQFKMVANAELILFNYDGVKGQKEVMIVEGEMDALTAIEIGYMNVCSVPNGASTGSSALEYLDNSWECLEDAEKIIIASDGDEAGVSLKNELIRRLGRERCYEIEYPEECKDLNEVLLKGGSKSVWDVINSAKALPVEGVLTVLDFDDDIDNAYTHGFASGYNVGYRKFDELLNFSAGQFTVISGVPNSGKSAFIDQILLLLAANHNWKIAVCSYEKQPIVLHFSNLAEAYVGKPFYRHKAEYKMNIDELNKAKGFIYEHFFWFKLKDVTLSIDSIIEKAKHLVKTNGINALLIDPWNYIEHKRPKEKTETEYVSDALSKLRFFAQDYGVHIFLIAHPTKIRKDKGGDKLEVPTLYDIAGSAHFYNKCDNGIIVYRNPDDIVSVYVQKVRFFMNGKRGFTDFIFDPHTQRYKEVGGEYKTLYSDIPESNYETDVPF